MEIHLVSSLTPDDENRLAPRVLAAIGEVLERLPVSYSVRIETAVGTAIHHNHTAALQDEPADTEPVVSGFRPVPQL
jgi:hypothetical protein